MSTPAPEERLIGTAADVGHLVREVRVQQGLTQPELAAASGTGVRFIVDLERGKPTVRLGLTLRVLWMLGIRLRAED